MRLSHASTFAGGFSIPRLHDRRFSPVAGAERNNRSLALCDFIHRRTRWANSARRRPGNCLNLKFYLPFKLSNKTPFRRHQSPVRTQTSGSGFPALRPAMPSQNPITDLLRPPLSSSCSHTRGCTFQIRFITAEVGRRILRALARLFTSRYVNTSSCIRASFVVVRDVKSRPIPDRTRSRRRSSGLADRSTGVLLRCRPVLGIFPRARGNSPCRFPFLSRQRKKEREKINIYLTRT